MTFDAKDETHDHATLSASGCERWWHCPGSPAAEATEPPSESIYAAEGTAAHLLASTCLLENKDAIEFIDHVMAGFVVDLEMASAVQVYLDECRAWIEIFGDDYAVERKFSLRSLNPPVPMFGTADFIIFSRDGGQLAVVDLKYGRGITVKAEGNRQLKYYALGVLLAFPDADVHSVITTIVQPRGQGEPVKTATYAVKEIREWSVELMERAYATLKPDAPLVPGSHCRFCRKAGKCVAQANAAFAVAQIEFDDVVEGLPARPPQATQLTPQQMGKMLHQLEVLEDFAASVRTAAQTLLENGTDIPGWKIVPKRPTRKWISEETAPFHLELTGVDPEKLWTRKLVSPKQAEEQLTHEYRKKGFKAGEAQSRAKADLKDLIVSASSGGTLAPAEDDRVALPSRGSEFEFEARPMLPDHGTELFEFENTLSAHVNS